MASPRRLSPDEAKRIILLILEEGYVERTDHCIKRMKERGITMPQLAHALKTGQVGATEWNDEHDNWKYEVEGVDTEGDTLTAITVIIENDLTLVIITTY